MMLAELARLTMLEEGSPQSFKVRAYENAIAGIEGHAGDLASMSKSELTTIKGVGSSTADKILEFNATAKVAKLEQLRERYPVQFVEMTKIPGLGPKSLKMIRDQLGVEDVAGLRAAAEQGLLRGLPGMGEKSEQKILSAIDRLGLHGKDRRTPLAETLGLAVSLATRIGEFPGVAHAQPSGSIRRFAETIGDIDIVVATVDPALVHQRVGDFSEVSEMIGSGSTKTSFLTREGLQIDVRTVEPDQIGSALLYFTGSKAHNIALRQRAIDRGLLLSEYGLFDGERVVASASEVDIYRALDLEPIPPTMREGRGEIEAAASGNLPAVIERDDIKGDLHFHSDRSGDGRSSLEEMVEAAIAAGYEYVCFTDHGEDLAINGASQAEMIAHRNRIRTLDSAYPEISLLFGCELNIGPEGQLDYDAGFRLEFDYCVASVHSHFDLSREAQTIRLLTALHDPAVNAIGHLSGRYVGRRPGIEIDLDKVLEALAVTGVALEVNGALDRLDATTEVTIRALEMGVDLVIDTDSHHTRDLVRMEYGVLYAQRAWVTPDRVINTRGVETIRSLVDSRR